MVFVGCYYLFVGHAEAYLAKEAIHAEAYAFMFL